MSVRLVSPAPRTTGKPSFPSAILALQLKKKFSL
jgi:hypothetical protein